MEVDDSASFFAHHNSVNNWDDLLHPKSLQDIPFHERSMQGAPTQSPYSHPELDTALNALQTGRAPPQHLQRLSPSNFDSSESLDLEQTNYGLFSNSAPSFGGAASRFRPYPSTNPPYGQDLLYPNGADAFNESVSPLSDPASPYPAGTGLSSSYNGGSGSPVSPPDSASALHRSPYSFSNVPGISPTTVEKVPQEFGHAGFQELMLDRRPSNPEHFDDFGLNVPNGFVGAQSRISGFPSDFSHPSAGALPIRPKQPVEMFRHVAPQATHGFKIEPNSAALQDSYQYGLGGPQSDLALRLPVTTMGVDETLSRMKLQAHSGSTGTDLQSFIRLADATHCIHTC